MTSRILVLHDTPSDFAGLLAARCAGAVVEYATSPEQVLPQLAAVQPTAVLSIKHSQFPGEAHLPALHFPSVRWFHVGGSGVDHLGTWDPAAVTVTHSAGVLAPFLAETAVAAMFSLVVGLPRYADQQRARQWRPHRFRALAGQTLLIVGVGSVGGELATRAKALGMRVLGVRTRAAPHPAVDRMVSSADLHAVLPLADVVSLHMRLDATTTGMFDAAAVRAMKPGALLLNSARGAVLDEDALLAALRSGALAGAWLDVFSQEPLPPEHPLWDAPNLLITPHCADQVTDFPRRFAERFCDLRDQRPPR